MESNTVRKIEKQRWDLFTRCDRDPLPTIAREMTLQRSASLTKPSMLSVDVVVPSLLPSFVPQPSSLTPKPTHLVTMLALQMIATNNVRRSVQPAALLDRCSERVGERVEERCLSTANERSDPTQNHKSTKTYPEKDSGQTEITDDPRFYQMINELLRDQQCIKKNVFDFLPYDSTSTSPKYNEMGTAKKVASKARKKIHQLCQCRGSQISLQENFLEKENQQLNTTFGIKIEQQQEQFCTSSNFSSVTKRSTSKENAQIIPCPSQNYLSYPPQCNPEMSVQTQEGCVPCSISKTTGFCTDMCTNSKPATLMDLMNESADQLFKRLKKPQMVYSLDEAQMD